MKLKAMKKPKRNIWTDTVSHYGTYEGEAGNPEQWKKAFEFVKMTREQALGIFQSINETPYDILGINKDATLEMVKSAMRKLVVVHHPDKGGDRVEFEKVMAAYTLLTTS